jgi:hypothetical protein
LKYFLSHSFSLNNQLFAEKKIKNKNKRNIFSLSSKTYIIKSILEEKKKKNSFVYKPTSVRRLYFRWSYVDDAAAATAVECI